MMQVGDCVENGVRKERQSCNMCVCVQVRTAKNGRGVSFLCKTRLTLSAVGKQRSTSQHHRIQTITHYYKLNTMRSSLWVRFRWRVRASLEGEVGLNEAETHRMQKNGKTVSVRQVRIREREGSRGKMG